MSSRAFQRKRSCKLLKDEFDVLYAEGQTRRRMLVMARHDRVAGRPARVKALGEFLEYAGNHANVWFARKDEIARWMLQKEGQQ